MDIQMNNLKKNYNLVVNGCSYMEVYARGQGHVDLANRLNITNTESLSIGGSANSRIIRTTLKHSYTATPTLYVIGLTFVSRDELPILKVPDEDQFEGRWVNPQNQDYADRYEHYWNRSESEKFVRFKQMTEVYSLPDRTEDLMYRVLSMIDSLHSRGHECVVYQQADDGYFCWLNNPKLQLFKNNPNIIGDFKWRAVPYQHANGVIARPDEGTGNFIGPQSVPDDIKHPPAGQHHVLNEYLYNYINNNLA